MTRFLLLLSYCHFLSVAPPSLVYSLPTRTYHNSKEGVLSSLMKPLSLDVDAA